MLAIHVSHRNREFALVLRAFSLLLSELNPPVDTVAVQISSPASTGNRLHLFNPSLDY